MGDINNGKVLPVTIAGRQNQQFVEIAAKGTLVRYCEQSHGHINKVTHYSVLVQMSELQMRLI